MICSRHSYLFLGTILIIFFVGVVFAKPARAVILNCGGGKNFTVADQQKLIKVAVPIPGVTFNCTGDDGLTSAYIEDLGTYIGGLYKFFSGAIGIIAAAMIFYAGIRWLTAGGNQAHVKSAKDTIATSLIAILIVLGSYLLLFTINPKLVNLRPPALKTVNQNEQSWALCPTSQTCQSGAQEGKNCTQDSDCGAGSKPGTCAWDVDITANDLLPACGKSYTYKKSLGSTGQKNTCTGMACLTNGVVDAGKACVSKTNPLDQPTAENGECVSLEERCTQITDSTEGVGAGRHDSLCTPLSVPKVGRCGWYDDYWWTLSSDRCAWRPLLKCPSGYDQTGCGECNTASEICLGVRFGSLNMASAKCDSTAAEDVYLGDATTDKQDVRAICCKQHTGTDLVCISGGK